MSTTNPTNPPPPDPTPQTGGPATPDPARSRAAHRAAPFELRRTGWDVVLGVALVVTGAFVLGDVAIASVISVLFLGWSLLIGGAVTVLLALTRVGRGGFWIGVITGALAFAAGLVFVRNPGLTLLALSLVIGSLLLVGGIVRIVAAMQEPGERAVLILSGALSIVLGLMILNRWPSSALWLLGTLLGIQLVVDGVLLMIVGRPRLPAASRTT